MLNLSSKLSKINSMVTDAIHSWLTPLLVISGPALMVISTTERYGQLHSESIYRMITTMLVTAGKQATRRCCNARSVFEMPWWSYSDTGIFASANRVGAIVSN